MQLSSMTGFAREQTTLAVGTKKYSWNWEFKSVNAKNMDIKVRLPQWLPELDGEVKSVCAKFFSRGTINVSLEIEVEESKPKIEIDQDLLYTLIDTTKDIFKQEPNFFSPPSPLEVLRVNGVVKIMESVPSEEEMKTLKSEICHSMVSAAQNLQADRIREGCKIGKALQTILSQIFKTIEQVEEISADMPQRLKEKINRQVDELLQNPEIPKERLAQETLFLIMRADVREELDRLKAHAQTAQELLNSHEPIGRRLDFLCQELNREANTLCSKSVDIQQTQCGMTLKTLIEQFREQIQNLE